MNSLSPVDFQIRNALAPLGIMQDRPLYGLPQGLATSAFTNFGDPQLSAALNDAVGAGSPLAGLEVSPVVARTLMQYRNNNKFLSNILNSIKTGFNNASAQAAPQKAIAEAKEAKALVINGVGIPGNPNAPATGQQQQPAAGTAQNPATATAQAPPANLNPFQDIINANLFGGTDPITSMLTNNAEAQKPLGFVPNSFSDEEGDDGGDFVDF